MDNRRLVYIKAMIDFVSLGIVNIILLYSVVVIKMVNLHSLLYAPLLISFN